MSATETLLARLNGVRRAGNGRWRAKCPAHGSKGGTLAIREEQDGRVLLHCHAACPVDDVLTAIGLELADLFPAPLGDHFPRVKRPWRVGDVVRAIEFELHVALVVLHDVEHGRPINDADRARAGVAANRVADFLRELRNAS